jgi:hypothetical protein
MRLRQLHWRALRRWPRLMMLIRFWVSLLRLDYPSIIDRCFRFIEMLIIIALVTVLLGVIESPFAVWFQLIASLAASLYLVVPFGNWWASIGTLRRHKHRQGYAALFSIVHAPFVVL